MCALWTHTEVIKGTSKSNSTGILIGAAAGGCVLVLLLLLAGIYAFHQKKRAKRATQLSNPFGKTITDILKYFQFYVMSYHQKLAGSWDSNSSSTGGPQLKGARSFTYEELKKCTNNFSESNAIGSGGYGKVS